MNWYKMIEKIYNKHAVKIKSRTSEGSGCIIQPLTDEYSYIFTAKHCISENNEFERNDITITQTDRIDNTLEILDIYIHEKYDIAILTIKKVVDLANTCIKNPTKDLPVSIYGYPSLLNNREEPKQNINCKVLFCKDNEYEICTDNVQFTFNKDTHQTIKGLSGSGVFFQESDKLLVTGILIELKAQDGAYNSLISYNINLFNELIQDKGLFPLNPDNLTTIYKDYDLTNKVFALCYTSESEPYYQERALDKTFVNYLNHTKNIWVSGESGVGKTLLVLRNISNENKKNIHIDLTCSSSEDINDYFKYINDELVEQSKLAEKSNKENIYDRISDNLCRINKLNQKLIIFVDEVPISNKDKFYQFLTGFINITEKYININRSSNTTKWIISTRINPIVHIIKGDDCFRNKEKADKNFIFKNFEPWVEKELIELLDLLQNSLNFSLSQTTQKEIAMTSNGLPGKIKRTIEHVLLNDITIKEAIELIKSENS